MKAELITVGDELLIGQVVNTNAVFLSKALNKIGTEARKELLEHYGKRVHLDLYVKIKEGWRESDRDLTNFGYK